MTGKLFKIFHGVGIGPLSKILAVNQQLFLQKTKPISGLVLTQLTTWDDWQAVQEFSWGWHWSTFKYIGC